VALRKPFNTSTWRVPVNLLCEEGTELAATWLALYVGSSLCAFAALVCGLFALAAYPLGGVLLTIGGMALLLYGTAGLCGAYQRRR